MISMQFVRRWWPVPILLGLGAVAEQIFRAQYPDAVGHAAGHLDSATPLFLGVAATSVIFWATPRAWREPEVVIAALTWIAALGWVMIANLEIVTALGSRNWTDADVERLGESLPGFVEGHDHVGTALKAAVVTAILLAITLLIRHHIGAGAAVGSIALSLVFPPWITPGAGVVVLVVATCMARRKRLRQVGAAEAPEGVSPDPSTRAET